jgi:hypothetical protein
MWCNCEWCWWLAAEQCVPTFWGVVDAPVGGDHAGLPKALGDFSGEAFIPELKTQPVWHWPRLCKNAPKPSRWSSWPERKNFSFNEINMLVN